MFRHDLVLADGIAAKVVTPVCIGEKFVNSPGTIDYVRDRNVIALCRKRTDVGFDMSDRKVQTNTLLRCLGLVIVSVVVRTDGIDFYVVPDVKRFFRVYLTPFAVSFDINSSSVFLISVGTIVSPTFLL